MSQSPEDTQLDHFIEEFSLTLEKSGLPRMAGRIMALLLICDPPHQNSAEIAERLHASRGSISSMTRLLVHAGIIQRLTLPKKRSIYFQIKPDTLITMIQAQDALVSELRRLAEEGLELLADAPLKQRERLELVEDLYGFFEREMPKLFDRWVAERKEKERAAKEGVKPVEPKT